MLVLLVIQLAVQCNLTMVLLDLDLELKVPEDELKTLLFFFGYHEAFFFFFPLRKMEHKITS